MQEIAILELNKQIKITLISAIILFIIGLIITNLLLLIKVSYWILISGFILGAIVSFINYGLLIWISYAVVNQNISSKFFLILIFIIKSLLYILVFIIGAYKNNWFNIFSVFAGTLILIISTYISQFLDSIIKKGGEDEDA